MEGRSRSMRIEMDTEIEIGTQLNLRVGTVLDFAGGDKDWVSAFVAKDYSSQLNDLSAAYLLKYFSRFWFLIISSRRYQNTK